MAIIENLQDEIERMKSRENQLVRDYSQKLRKLEDPDTAAALETICKAPFDEDMPVDEFTSRVRTEQRARKNEDIQSRRFLMEIRSKMEAILKEKMKEVLFLNKRVEELEKEKDSLTQQLETKESKKLLEPPPPVPISTVDSVIGTQFIGDESFEDMSFSLNNHLSSEISLENMFRALGDLVHGKKDAEHYSYLNVNEKQLFEKFKLLYAKVAQVKSIELQKKMGKLSASSKEKDARIQELELQVRKLQSDLLEKEDILRSIPERNILQNQMIEIVQQKNTLEQNLKLLESEKEAWIQNQARIQEKNDESISAIQRVLADVTLTKDREIMELKERLRRIAGEECLMEPL